MSSNNSSGSGLMVFALAALLGFGAVYATLGRRDNAPPAQPAPAGAPAQQVAAPKTEIPTAPNTGSKTEPTTASKPGAMAAFVTRKAPEALTDITFTDGAGNPLKLSDFKGRTVLLNIWATWCAPCREEMPALDRLQKTLGSDKFEVVALSIDRQGIDASRKFLTEVKASNLKLYVDPTAKQGTALKLVGMPTTILINRDGLEIGRLAGPAEWDSEDAKTLIEAAMK